MKVIAFSLSLFHPTARRSKERLTVDASRLLTFRNFGFGKDHAAPDFSEGTWRGFSVLMAFSLRNPTRIASLRLDKFVCSLRSSNSLAQAGENGLPRRVTWTLKAVCEPMSFLATCFVILFALAVSFGAVYFKALPLEVLLKIMLHGMGLEQP